jgi:phosphatidate phosphatase APP1
VFSTIHAFTRHALEQPKVVLFDGETNQELARVTGDKNGMYEARLRGPFPTGTRRFIVKLAHPGYAADTVTEQVTIVDAADAGLVLVTDIDDTIIDTGVTGDRMELVKKILTSNAADIKALPGAAESLRAHAAAGIPIVYVSASPVELGPRLTEFLRLRGFPGGALFLRSWDVDGKGDPSPYKRRMFKRVAEDYPKRRLILFGDNGEKDPEIFRIFAKDSGRVAASFIRVTVPAKASEPRYQGIILFTDWADVVRLSSAHAPGLDPQGRRP